MAASEQTIDISRFINDRKIGSFQFLVVALCALTIFLDGFDAQSIAFVAPSIVREWHVARGALGPIFVASLVGLLVGALLFGPLADKIGRRTVLMLCTFAFGAMTLATAMAGNVTELMLFRFLAGLGLGGAMPNAIALTAEYCPQRRRATFVMIMFTGFSLGAAAGGLLAALMIPTFGWRSLWWIGGAVPLVLLAIQYAALPESIRFLVLSHRPPAQIAALVRRIDPGFEVAAGTRFDIGDLRSTGVPVAQLFRDRRAVATLLLWVVFFMTLLDLYFLQNWIPILTTDAGVPVRTAVLIGSLFQVGGVVAALSMGFAIDRFGAYVVLPILYGLGCLCVIALGRAGGSVSLLAALTLGAGFCVVGAQTSANAQAAIFYPTSMRASGVGWCLGIGRFGAIVGPLLGGVLLSLHWPHATVFIILATPLVAAALAIIAMGLIYTGSRRSLREAPATAAEGSLRS